MCIAGARRDAGSSGESMSAPKKYQLDHITDVAKLSRDQFERMLPDFLAWFDYVKRIEDLGIGANAVGFTWIDDNNPGNIQRVAICLASGDKDDGRGMHWKKPGATHDKR